MGYITCKNCGCQMSDKSEACPMCGTVVEENSNSETKGTYGEGRLQTPIQKPTVRLDSSSTNEDSKRKVSPIIWGITVVIVAAVVVFLLIKTNGEQAPDNNTAPSHDLFIDSIESPANAAAAEPVCNDIPKNFVYEHYYNDRFGFEFDYPSFFLVRTASENGDGCNFAYLDYEIVSYGEFNVLDYTMEEIINESKEGMVTYSDVKSRWGVVSGIDDDERIYYIKQYLAEDVIYTLIIRYPQNQKSKFDHILKIILDSYSFPSRLGY